MPEELTEEEIAAAKALAAKAAQQTAVLSELAAVAKQAIELLGDATTAASKAAAVGLTTAPPVEGAIAGTLEGISASDIAGELQLLAAIETAIAADVAGGTGTVEDAINRMAIASR